MTVEILTRLGIAIIVPFICVALAVILPFVALFTKSDNWSLKDVCGKHDR